MARITLVGLIVGLNVCALASSSSTFKRASVLTFSLARNTSATRRCNGGGYDVATYFERTEAVFSQDGVASDIAFDHTSPSAMTAATDRIGFVLLYNDGTRPGWTFSDDDGSFLLKHKTKPMILVPETGGTYDRDVPNGARLVWVSCPTDCVNDFSRDEYLTYGYVFETRYGEVCLPPGV